MVKNTNRLHLFLSLFHANLREIYRQDVIYSERARDEKVNMCTHIHIHTYTYMYMYI